MEDLEGCKASSRNHLFLNFYSSTYVQYNQLVDDDTRKIAYE